MKESIIDILNHSLLFKGMDIQEIEEFLKSSASFVSTYEKNEIIFDMHEKPEYLFVLLEGSISVAKDSISGKRTLITNIDDPGNIFAEVYLFLPKEHYDYYTLALESNTRILKIPKSVFGSLGRENCNQKLVTNMLRILSQKAYNLTEKLQVLASGGLRQKLARLLLDGMDEDNNVILAMSRENMADYLNVARPSLSRELANMNAEGLIEVKGRQIKVLEPEELEMML